jgi:deoxyadenosine/deoxycytidine kinase
MGVGKSTLTAALAERVGARAWFEAVDANPYLERFYEDMARWAFRSQFTFLSQAFHQHTEILARDGISVQDRTIYEHYHVFATSLHDQGLLDDDDFAVLGSHYEALARVVPGPDLMVYLRAPVPVLVDRIRGRDRSCESDVSVEYLQGLEARYERWMAQYESSDVLVIDTEDVDIHDPEHREQLLGLLEERIAGRPARAPFARLRRRDDRSGSAALPTGAAAPLPAT